MGSFFVYILYSKKLKQYYIGTTDSVESRLDEHNKGSYATSFTKNGIPWELVFVIDELSSSQAIAIEKHIKKMKSSVFISNLVRYPEMIKKLKERYSLVRSR